VTRDASGTVVRSVSGVAAGSLIRTRLTDGELVSTVNESGDQVGTDIAAEPGAPAETQQDGGKQ
jgi:hypothetical protein